jgi:hypothetical protein
MFLACHVLTGTILPLELIYEHRNYFASFGLLIAVVPVLTMVPNTDPFNERDIRMRLKYAIFAALMCFWVGTTMISAYAWGDTLRLAEELVRRAPLSPRAQYELGRTYIIYSHYDASSPFTPKVYPPLEAAAALPNSSILPQQALIFFNARLGRPIKREWWQSMLRKLKERKPGIQDESSLIALVQCAHDDHCALPQDDMTSAFQAALSHSPPSARLLAAYSDYTWNLLNDRRKALGLAIEATRVAPGEPAYWLTLARMQLALGQRTEAGRSLKHLEQLNIGGALDLELTELKAAIAMSTSALPTG